LKGQRTRPISWPCSSAWRPHMKGIYKDMKGYTRPHMKGIYKDMKGYTRPHMKGIYKGANGVETALEHARMWTAKADRVFNIDCTRVYA